MEMAVEVAVLTGWSLRDTYRDLTFPRYNALQKFWKRWPPIVVSAAVLAGVSPKSSTDSVPTAASEVDEEGMADLIAAFGAPQPLPKELQQ